MADMAAIGPVEACWSDLSSLLDSRKIVHVTYMNSTAAIKAFTGEHGGSVCTSSNAAEVMKWAFESGEKVLFLPDEHLGRNTGYRMGIPLEQMIVWDPYQEFGGNTPEPIRTARIILCKCYCSVHHRRAPPRGWLAPACSLRCSICVRKSFDPELCEGKSVLFSRRKVDPRTESEWRPKTTTRKKTNPQTPRGASSRGPKRTAPARSSNL